MYDETNDLFIFDLKAMSAKSPKMIFTYQDAVMTKAISHVMPNTTWHIMQNALKHVNYVFKGPRRVKSALSTFMESIEEKVQFSSAWNAMLEEYDVYDNNLLKSVFELKGEMGLCM